MIPSLILTTFGGLHSLHNFSCICLHQPLLNDFSLCLQNGSERKAGNKQNLKSECPSSWSCLMQNICWLDISWHVASLLWNGDLNDVKERQQILLKPDITKWNPGVSACCYTSECIFKNVCRTYFISRWLILWFNFFIIFFISIIFCIYGSTQVHKATIICSGRCSPARCDGRHSGSALTMTRGSKTCIRPSDSDTVAFSTFAVPEQPITDGGRLLHLYFL